jgi:hypothetical protein
VALDFARRPRERRRRTWILDTVHAAERRWSLPARRFSALLSAQGREFLEGLELPDAARERIEVALAKSKRSTASWTRSSNSCAGWPAARPVAGR